MVDAVTGKTEATPEGQAETGVVLALFYFFLLILVEGLLLAGSVSASGAYLGCIVKLYAWFWHPP